MQPALGSACSQVSFNSIDVLGAFYSVLINFKSLCRLFAFLSLIL